jgi:hypothetical protein
MPQPPLPSSQFLELSDPRKSFLTKSEMIAGFLQNLALPSVFHRELTTADYELWDRLLSPYSAQAIEYAFDSWGRNGLKFPLPKDIIGLIDAYCSPPRFERTLPAGRQVLDNHWPAWWWMFTKVTERIEKADRERRPYVPLGDKEIEDLATQSREYLETRGR